MRVHIGSVLLCLAVSRSVSSSDLFSNWNGGNQLQDQADESRSIGREYCGKERTDRAGECTTLPSCVAHGGKLDSSTRCNYFPFHVCCKYNYDCGDVMKSNIGYWRSKNYPAYSDRNGRCQLTVKPASDTCYIRIQFEDAHLSSANPSSCDDNTLIIRNQAEGDGSPICGPLTNIETLIRVKKTGSFRGKGKILLDLNIRDTSFKFKIKITRIACSQISGITDESSGRSYGSKSLTNLDSNNIQLKLRDNTDESLLKSSARPEGQRAFANSHRLNGSIQVEKPTGQIELQNFLDTVINDIEHTLKNINKTDERSSHPFSVSVRNQTEQDTSLCAGRSISTTNPPAWYCLAEVNIGNGITDSEEDTLYCGCSVIANNYVITSSSCLLHNGYDADGYGFRIYFYDQGEYGAVKRVIIHPMYANNRFDYDVAIIEFIPDGQQYSPVALQTTGDIDENAKVDVVLSISYKRTPGIVLLNTVCQNYFNDQFFPREIDAHDMCIEKCPGDSPATVNLGPVVDARSGTDVLIGIVPNTQNQADIVIGTRITAVIDFINAATTDFKYTNSPDDFSDIMQSILSVIVFIGVFLFLN